MDIYRVIHSTLSMVNAAVRVVGEDRKLTREQQGELDQVMSHMHMMNAFIKSQHEGASSQVVLEEVWILQLQNLAYDIEDFIDLMDTKPKPVFISRVARMVVNLDPRVENTNKIRTFQSRVEILQKWKAQFPPPAPLNGNPDNNNTGGDDDSSGEPPVGMKEPKGDLRELLLHAEAGQREQPRVISIVGPRGLGKTTLAHEVYREHEHDSLGQKFEFRAWVPLPLPPTPSPSSGGKVVMSASARDLLKGILMQVKDDQEVALRREDATDLIELRRILKLYLENKRYLIVIDGVRKAEVWDSMKSAFPKGKTSSVIITTTSVQSVATACSSGGYVYKMRGLNMEDSKELFWKNVLTTEHDDRYPDLKKYSEMILTKCAGLPLAVLSVARFLRLQEKSFVQNYCKQACQLGKYLGAAGHHGAFEELRRALVESYEGLPCDAYDLKACLLSMSMFPRDSDINRKSLARRWIAEGLVTNAEQDDLAALEGFHKLIDGSIIEASPAKDQRSLKPGMKRCRVHGVMLEFLINKSISKNFASPRTKGNFFSAHPAGCSIRRLSLDGTHNKNVKTEELRCVRSLNMVGCELLDLGKCKHMRLLDLEKCTGVNLQVLRNICKLVLLKYLNLRGTDVSVLPQEMGKLRHLEMLDVRDAKVADPVIKLPLEVILLPHLAYLFGKFELPEQIKDEVAANIGRQMHTLSGFVISNRTTNGPATAANNLTGSGFSSSQRWASIKRTVTSASSRKDKTPLLSGSTGSSSSSSTTTTTTTTNNNNNNNNNATAATAGNDSKNHSFQCILHQMKQLKKLKIWWGSSDEAPSEQLIEVLVSSLQERFSFTNGLESLSLHFGNQHIDFLDKLELKKGSSITLESIKLHGKLSKLPSFITEADALPNLEEVHLSWTGLCSKDFLVLKGLSFLKYLKIVEEDSNEGFGDGSLDVGDNDFPSLKGLFVQAKKLPQVNITQGGNSTQGAIGDSSLDVGDNDSPSLKGLFVQAKKQPQVNITQGGNSTQGAMKYLTTLQLICDDVQGFPVTHIAHFKNLDQVVLKSSLQDAKRNEWKEGTNKHSNRPRLEFLI